MARNIAFSSTLRVDYDDINCVGVLSGCRTCPTYNFKGSGVVCGGMVVHSLSILRIWRVMLL